MTTALMVIAPTVFRDEEYAEPKRVLEAHGVSVTTASVAPGECIGKLGMHATADTLGRRRGGSRVGRRRVRRRRRRAGVLRRPGRAPFGYERRPKSGRVLAAICIAPSTLAHAGLLQGRSCDRVSLAGGRPGRARRAVDG